MSDTCTIEVYATGPDPGITEAFILPLAHAWNETVATTRSGLAYFRSQWSRGGIGDLDEELPRASAAGVTCVAIEFGDYDCQDDPAIRIVSPALEEPLEIIGRQEEGSRYHRTLAQTAYAALPESCREIFAAAVASLGWAQAEDLEPSLH